MIDTRVTFAGVEFQNPVVTGSGTFGFGKEYGEYVDLNQLGGITLKGLTLKMREGNKPPRIAETPAGILNSVGLQNPGVNYFVTRELPGLTQYNTRLIANIAGNTIEEYCEMAEILSDSEVDIIEMNISCPNVKEGGVAFGVCPATVEEISGSVRRRCKKPLVVKLSPNVSDITEIARAAEAGGADGLSLINTLLGMKIDVHTRRPVLANNVGGLSGPCVKPVAVRMVWQVHNAVKLPIIGMGGIMSGEDAVEFLLAGASLVSVGTANFVNPTASVEVARGIERYMEQYGVTKVTDLIGAVQPNE